MSTTSIWARLRLRLLLLGTTQLLTTLDARGTACCYNYKDSISARFNKQFWKGLLHSYTLSSGEKTLFDCIIWISIKLQANTSDIKFWKGLDAKKENLGKSPDKVKTQYGIDNFIGWPKWQVHFC